jgi:hypothetical protein
VCTVRGKEGVVRREIKRSYWEEKINEENTTEEKRRRREDGR